MLYYSYLFQTFFNMKVKQLRLAAIKKGKQEREKKEKERKEQEDLARPRED